MKFQTLIMKIGMIAISIFCTQIAFSQNETVTPYSITDYFIASGYMGDRVRFIKNSKEDPLDGETCIKVSYTAKNRLWGGLYLQKPANNWCEKAGVDLSTKGFSKLTFWAKGKDGNEEIKFLAGHDCGDSVEEEKTVTLESKWQQYTIDLTDKDLSNITGAFGFSIDSKAQFGPITFYLDDIQFE